MKGMKEEIILPRRYFACQSEWRMHIPLADCTSSYGFTSFFKSFI
jgi:hypothetical protein